MNYLPIIGILVIVLGLLAYSGRARRRQAEAAAARTAAIVVGAEVMTTSGLYGTVVALNGDAENNSGTVVLSIAPGVEVTWALAALREVESLPERYRLTEADADSDPAPDAHAKAGSDEDSDASSATDAATSPDDSKESGTP